LRGHGNHSRAFVFGRQASQNGKDRNPKREWKGYPKKANGMNTKGQKENTSQGFRNRNGMIPKKRKGRDSKKRKVRIPNRERWDPKKEKVGTPRG